MELPYTRPGSRARRTVVLSSATKMSTQSTGEEHLKRPRCTSRIGGFCCALILCFGGVGFTPIVSLSQPDPDTLWTRVLQAGGDCYGMCQSPDGGFVIASEVGGLRSDVMITKLDGNGELVWSYAYGDPDLSERATDIIAVAEGGYLAAGQVYGFPILPDPQNYLIRLTENGDTLWTRTWGIELQDILWSVKEAPGGGFIATGLAGHTGGPATGSLGCYRLDAAGNVLWTRLFASDAPLRGREVVLSGSGQFIITGTSGSGGYNDSSRSVILGLDSTGGELWRSELAGFRRVECGAACGTPEGGVVTSGAIFDESVDGYDTYFACLSGSGQLLWSRGFAGSGNEFVYGVVACPQGGYAAVADTDRQPDTGSDMWLLKLAESGDTLWTRNYGGTGNEIGLSLVSCPDGSFVVSGQRWGDANYSGLLVVRTGPGGLDSAPDNRIPVPEHSTLRCYPNPFNASTEIRFDLPEAMHTELNIFDLLGREIATLLNEPLASGQHRIHFDARALPTGIYFYRLHAGDYDVTRKMLLLR